MYQNKSTGSEPIDKHLKLNGKIDINSKVPIKSATDLSVYYTPGVGEVASYLSRHKNKTSKLTIRGNTVAIISDGSSVLGLGNIGPEGAIPVMEGKAMLFKQFAGINAFPIVLDTQNEEEIVNTVVNISPIFGGINLEDITAPKCFGVERKIQGKLDIPVFHDDQHGTAIVVLAGIINAFKVARKNIKKSKFVVVGAGAAGTATAKILIDYGVSDLTIVDSRGIISSNRSDLNYHKKRLASISNKSQIQGTVEDAAKNSDVVIAVSKGSILKKRLVERMNKKPIIFALSNPTPEIMPSVAKEAGAFIVATGRSDFENQINNALVFPGIFRGALDNKVKKITTKMKIAAAKNLAAVVKQPTTTNIIPSIFDKRVVEAIASTIK